MGKEAVGIIRCRRRWAGASSSELLGYTGADSSALEKQKFLNLVLNKNVLALQAQESCCRRRKAACCTEVRTGDRHSGKAWTTGYLCSPPLSSEKASDSGPKDRFKPNHVLALHLNQGYATELGSQECPPAQCATKDMSRTMYCFPR